MAGPSEIECVNYIRAFCADVVQKANSGHPGAPMGMAPMAHVLFTKFLNYSPANPKWANRDRFILSNGHACALLYTMLHLAGYEQFPLDQLEHFRQMGYRTAGHPEGIYDGIEVSTGPLGQGFSNAVGLAMAEAHLSALYNKPGFDLFSNRTFVFCGDGCLMEGITSEAASLAGHLGLGRLIVLYDDNKISIDGGTDLAFSENVPQRFEAYGWHTQTVEHGDSDLEAIARAIHNAIEVQDRPSLISVKTTIGFGSKSEATAKVHGSPLGWDDIANVKKKFGLDPEKRFYIPDDVRGVYNIHRDIGQQKEQAWNDLFARYRDQFPAEAAEVERRFAGRLPDGWQNALPRYKSSDKGKATRIFSYECIQALAPVLPELIGGSADLAPSTKTIIESSHDFQKGHYDGRNIRFGVREHAMAAIVNGLAAYGGFLPYGATFLNFLGYCLGSVTLSALTGHHMFHVMTHDSIGLGEDGPTHQPVEKLMICRSTPHLVLLRPADGNETAGAYAIVVEAKKPAILALSRQDVPNVEGTSLEAVKKGAYSVVEVENPELILVGTGSELYLCVEAAKQAALQERRVRVVSMPSWELFDDQPQEYRLSVFPDGAPVLSVEAGVTCGWSRYAHASVGVDSFGISAPYEQIYEHFGLTPSKIADKAVKVLNFYKDRPVPSRLNVPEL